MISNVMNMTQFCLLESNLKVMFAKKGVDHKKPKRGMRLIVKIKDCYYRDFFDIVTFLVSQYCRLPGPSKREALYKACL